MKVIVFILIYVLTLTLAHAGNFEDGLKAYNDKNYQTAIMFFEKACKENNSEACNTMGLIYVEEMLQDTTNSEIIKINNELAIKYFSLACDKGNGEACNNLAVASSGIVKNFGVSEALKLFIKSCNLGCGQGCGNVSLIYISVQNYVNFTKAKEFSEKGCNLKDPCSCFDLGTLHYFGRGVKLNKQLGDYYTDLSDEYGHCKIAEHLRNKLRQ